MENIKRSRTSEYLTAYFKISLSEYNKKLSFPASCLSKAHRVVRLHVSDVE